MDTRHTFILRQEWSAEVRISTEVHLDNSLLMYSGITCYKEVGVFMYLQILIMRIQSEMIHEKEDKGAEKNQRMYI